MLLQTHYFDHTFASTFLSLKTKASFSQKVKRKCRLLKKEKEKKNKNGSIFKSWE